MLSALADHTRSDLVSTCRELLPWTREQLAAYVATESPSGDVTALDVMARRLAASHRVLDGDVEQVTGPAGTHLVTTWAADAPGPPLCLLAHYDTVWPCGQLERMPFDDDGTSATGPGVYDMKGGLVVLECALRALAALDLRPAQPVRAIVAADEEVGSPTAHDTVTERAAGAAAVLGLEPPHSAGGLKTGRRGSTRLRIEVHGREAHAALDPGRGVPAIDELLDQLAAARHTADRPGVMFNIGDIAGGGRTNVVAGWARADLGLRFTDPTTEREVLGELRDVRPHRQGAQVRVEVLSNRPAWPEPASAALLDLVADLGTQLGQRVTGAPAAGAGDTNVTGAVGHWCLDGFGPLGAGAHALHERVEVPSIADRAALLAAVMLTPLESALRGDETH